MQAAQIVSETRSETVQILIKIEEAQALADALVQQWDKLGGSASISGYDWGSSDITEQEFLDGMNSLGTLFPDILGAHGTNLYKLKW